MKRITALFILLIALLVSCSPTGPANTESEKDVVYTENIPVMDAGSTLPSNWWKSAVFYEVFVRSYKDSNGDGKGDIQGLISKLDYIRDLGANAIWLMPITESGWNYNGYDVEDYRAVEKDYGTIDDFKQLLSEAHKRGIAVIIDFVINHTKDTHPFFINSANDGSYRNWYVWEDTLPDVKTWGKTWHEKNGRFYYSHFSENLPDLNFNNPSVVAYTRDTAKFWLNLGVDGFRVDMASALYENGPDQQNNQPETHEFYREFRKLIDQYQNRFIVSEAEYNNEYLGNGTDEFNSSFAFSYAGYAYTYNTNPPYPLSGDGVKGAILYEQGFTLSQIACKASTSPEGSMLATLLSNHDPFAGGKPYSVFNGDLNKCKLAASILLTTPGIPFIYYGEEIAMKRYDATGDWYAANGDILWEDERIRTPMQWDATTNAGFTTASKPYIPMNDNSAAFNVQTESSETTSVLSHYKKLIAIRKNNPALLTGKGEIAITSNDSSTSAWVMSKGNDRVLVSANLTNSEIIITVNLVGTAFADGSLYAAYVDLLDGVSNYGNVTTSNSDAYQITVPAYGVRILPFKKAVSLAYDANGGSGTVPVDSTLYPTGSPITVKGNTGSLVLSGFSFIGWNTQPDGLGQTYAMNETITSGETDLVLYAVWSVNPTCTVTYNGNGNISGDPPSVPVSYDSGSSFTVLGNSGNLANSGSFKEWNSKPDGTGVKYLSGEIYSIGALDITLYAQWHGSMYNIGDTGPAGGLIFYDKGNYLDGWRYLETSLEDQSKTGISWAPALTIVNGTSSVIGSGKNNTHLIIEAVGENVYAAKVCSDFRLNGYQDWFLPSINELETMYTNLKVNNLGSFDNTYYWSSTQYGSNSSTASVREFIYSPYHLFTGINKDDVYGIHIRAIRSF